MGVTVLQTSLENASPGEVYTLYKKRWTIETFYNYFKNKAGYNSLHAEDYYKTQGLAFVMLVSALIHQEMEAAVANIDIVKAHKRHDNWIVCNCLKKQVELFKQLNTPLEVAMPLHT